MANLHSNPKKLVSLAHTLHPRLLRFFARYPPAAIVPTLTEPAPALPNPFKCQKHLVTGRRHDPVFSLRRQAEIVKLARKQGVEELLPHTVKGTEERMKRRAENGLRVKGTGVGQKVKGKESERTLKGRLEKRRQAMLDMPQMIQTWKERGHGRGWKKWPK
ncbi:putative 54S ribosomal protein L25, mitochondrial [Calycina marina]|uniref:54S ribosomal protein L25, mitochondrial n=1 Tax=Calycina marina TaxID=1763456 RepID=A0A9P8CJF6_9HELO|nr:putative 54S ribosomal protein L25, mitochondrial [Calycina marina]